MAQREGLEAVSKSDSERRQDEQKPTTEIDSRIFSELPLSLVARCVSFNIESFVDIARMSKVSKEFAGALKGIVFAAAKDRNCTIKCSLWKESEMISTLFREQDPDYLYDYHRTTVGDEYDSDIPEANIFPGATLTRFLIARPPCNLAEFIATTIKNDRSIISKDSKNPHRPRMIEEHCIHLRNAKSFDDLGSDPDFFLPVMRPDSPRLELAGEPGNYSIFPVFASFKIPTGADCIKRISELEDGTTFLEITATDKYDDEFVFGAIDIGSTFQAVVRSQTEESFTVDVLMHIFGNTDDTQEQFWDMESKSQLHVIWSIVNRFQSRMTAPVEGVAIVDNVVGRDFHELLNDQINALADTQEKKGLADYHPHSGDVVRDIIHPALYSYVKNTSTLRVPVDQSSACIFPDHDSIGHEDGEDYFGRKYEDSSYQWLPTYFSISPQGKVTIEDYINNLVPRDDPVNGPLYSTFARLFERCLPAVESVYSYLCSIRDQLDDDPDYFDEDQPPKFVPYRLYGQRLQVITKVIDYELKPGIPYEGAWHVEGMSHENIVMTVLYIADRDDGIDGGEIKYKRAFLTCEMNGIFMSTPQDRHRALEDFIEQGLLPLGQVETRKGRLIVFPNSHVHKVSEMINAGDAMARRRIVCFFIVNPLHRIVSTREVAPQQEQMSLQEAHNHRLELMKERKFYKQSWNVRQIELCEH